MEENGLTLLKQEMQTEDVQHKVNAIHKMKTVILSLGDDDTVTQLIPYLDELIRNEDDEVLFAIAEEIGNVTELMHD